MSIAENMKMALSSLFAHNALDLNDDWNHSWCRFGYHGCCDWAGR